MSDDNQTVDIEDVNLDDFEAEFFNSEPKAEAKAKEATEDEVEEVVEENVVENEDDSLAPEDDEAEDEDEQDEDDDSEEEEVEEVPQIKQKRNKTQERIEKLVAEARTAERERDALRVELERLQAGTEVKQPEAVKPQLQLPPEAPSPDAKGEDGEPLYELGEFDPKFIRDLTRFTIAEETKAAKEVAQKEAEAQAMQKAQDELASSWNEKVSEAEKELPELRQNILTLTNTFQNIEPGYGEYLAATIMGLDAGPEVMNYLSQNIGEAQKIVASGPVAATLALGRLEAKLTTAPVQEEKRNTRLVSKASEPPVSIEQARGRGGKFAVAPDTDNLDAFEREFFK